MRNDRDQESELEPVPDGSLVAPNNGWMDGLVAVVVDGSEGQETIESGGVRNQTFIVIQEKNHEEGECARMKDESGDQEKCDQTHIWFLSPSFYMFKLQLYSNVGKYREGGLREILSGRLVRWIIPGIIYSLTTIL